MQLDEQLIKKFNETNLLSKMGEAYKGDIKTKSLKKISKSIAGLKWENICLEEVNQVKGWLSVNNPNEYNLYWNDMVNQIKATVIPDLIIKLDAMLLEDKITESIKTAVVFDVINIIMINSYCDIIRSEFYSEMLEIYLLGHLPYGWEGNYPKGRILVF